LLRQSGSGTALDVYENWCYDRLLPSDTPPDVRSLMSAPNGSATATDACLPPLPVTTDGQGGTRSPVHAR
jgi:hypothetical protein